MLFSREDAPVRAGAEAKVKSKGDAGAGFAEALAPFLPMPVPPNSFLRSLTQSGLGLLRRKVLTRGRYFPLVKLADSAPLRTRR
jgi:hypothetical protein